MATIDMTQRKLHFPPRFLPYLEKHKIFELFHECVELFVTVRPKDHVWFLKNVLALANAKKDKQRIVFFSPPGFNRKKFVEMLGECLGIPVISKAILEKLTVEKNLVDEMKYSEMAEMSEESCVCPGEEPYYPLFFGEGEEETGGRRFLRDEIEGERDKEELGEDEEKKREGDEGDGTGPDDGETRGGKTNLDKEGEEEPCETVCPCVSEGREEVSAETKKDVTIEGLPTSKTEMGKGSESGKDKSKEVSRSGDLNKDKEKSKSKELTKDKEKEKEKDKSKEITKGAEWTTRRELSLGEEEGEQLERMGEDGEYGWCTDSQRMKAKRQDELESSTQTYRFTESSSEINSDYYLLADTELLSKGWILLDLPRNGEQAEMFSSLGILPTHALRIIVDEEEEENDEDYMNEVRSWMKAYQYIPAIEIRMGDRDLSDLTRDLCRLLRLMPHRHAPMLFRVVLIGSRGCGAKTQAKMLSKKYGMVHVDFDLVVARALQQDDELSKMFKLQKEYKVDPELEAFILERALLTPQCRKRGWVLTGYPKNCDQMRMLDIIATPPNKVIFIEVPPKECFVRLYYRKFDPCLGDEYKLPKILPYGADSYEAPDLDPEVAARLLSHPKNDRSKIIKEIEEFFLEKEGIQEYCGRSPYFVDGDKPVNSVFQLIENALISPLPPHSPRKPLECNYGIKEAHERLKKYRLASGLYFNNLVLNPPPRPTL